MTPPPSAAGLAVSSGVTNLFVQIDAPTYTWGGGNKQTNIYGVSKDKDDPTLPTFGDAQLIYTMPAALTVAAIPSEPGRRWHIWAKHESYAGVESVAPTGGINGQSATLGDAENLIEFLQVAAAWINSAMVASLSAAHLTVGDGTVGGPLRSTNYTPSTSGWLLDSALGRLYAMDAVISGTVYASYGNIGGWSIFSDSIESWNFDGVSQGIKLDASTGKLTAFGAEIRGELYADDIVFGTLSGDVIQDGTISKRFYNILGTNTIVANNSLLGNAFLMDVTKPSGANWTGELLLTISCEITATAAIQTVHTELELFNGILWLNAGLQSHSMFAPNGTVYRHTLHARIPVNASTYQYIPIEKVRAAIATVGCSLVMEQGTSSMALIFMSK